MNLDRLIQGLTDCQYSAMQSQLPIDRISDKTNAACRAALRKIGLVEPDGMVLTALGREIRARLGNPHEKD